MNKKIKTIVIVCFSVVVIAIVILFALHPGTARAIQDFRSKNAIKNAPPEQRPGAFAKAAIVEFKAETPESLKISKVGAGGGANQTVINFNFDKSAYPNQKLIYTNIYHIVNNKKEYVNEGYFIGKNNSVLNLIVKDVNKLQGEQIYAIVPINYFRLEQPAKYIKVDFSKGKRYTLFELNKFFE